MTLSSREFYKLALIGHPVSHSLSPLMHRAALSFCRLDGDYELIDMPPPLDGAHLQSMAKNGYAGFNVTIPHKQAVMPFLDNLTVEAENVQAVNTIRVENDGSLTGHNTDLGGFVNALSGLISSAAKNANGVNRFIPPADRKLTGAVACIVGAGGAARAALWGLKQLGVTDVWLLARNQSQADTLRSDFEQRRTRAQSLAEPNVNVRVRTLTDNMADNFSDLQFNLLINTVPIGLTEPQLPLWFHSILVRLGESASASGLTPVVYDMVYSKSGRTPVRSAASELGIPAADGLDMLIGQASLAFEFWTGHNVPCSHMASALTSANC